MMSDDPRIQARSGMDVQHPYGSVTGGPFLAESAAAQSKGTVTTSQPMIGGSPMDSGTQSMGMGAEDLPSEPTYVPLIDVINSAEEIRIVIDTPGFEEDDITIEADDGVLIISAERESAYSGRSRHRHVERPRLLERTIQLPAGADPDTAWAEYENGTAIIVFDKNESERHHQIGFQ